MNKPRTKDEYHAMTDVVSATMLKQLRQDCQVFYDTYEEPDPDKRQPPFVETKPMETGSIIHSVILDGATLRSIVGVYPEFDPDLAAIKTLTGPKRDQLSDDELQRYAKICNTQWQVLLAAKGGKDLNAITANAPENVISESGVMSSKAAARYREANPDYRYFVKRLGDMNNGKTAGYETLQAAISAIKNSEYYKILESDDVIKETPLFWTDELTGIECRCCPDFILIKGTRAWVWDLKISEFATNLEKQMNALDWHIQDEHYSRGVLANYPEVETLSYTFLGCKPTYPFHVTENKFKGTDRPRILQDYTGTLHRLKQLKETGDWRHPATKATNEVELKTWTTTYAL